MYIGVLNKAGSGLSGKVSFWQRGTKLPLALDTGSGLAGKTSLALDEDTAGRPYGWQWTTLFDVGVDITVELDRECFLGAVSLELAAGSAAEAIEVFRDNDCVGQLDCAVAGQVLVPVGSSGQSFLIRLKACLKDIILDQFDLVGADLAQPQVFPEPASSKAGGAGLLLQDIQGLALADDSADLAFAARHLQQRFQERFAVQLDLAAGPGPGIHLALDPAIPEQGYKLSVSPAGVQLSAQGRLGLLYAAETLVQLFNEGQFTGCVIEDQPYQAIRGFHIGLPPREEMEFARRLIRYVLIPLKYNILFLEFAGGMRFDSHPEIGRAWLEGNQAGRAGLQPKFPHGEMVAGGGLLEKDEVRDFVTYAKDYGLEVIPEVQSLGHVQYITYAYPHIAEIEAGQTGKILDTRAADQPPSSFYHHSYCPLLEESYSIIFDLIDEIVAVVQPERYVHMGHDEVYQIGICPRCQDQDPADLLAGHLNRLHGYLAQKDLGMMIWADMLQPVTKYKTPPAIAKIAKDIVLLDFVWYFHFDLDLEDNLLQHGFNVVMGNLYSSHYPRYSSRIAKPGMLGGQVSSWCRLDEYTLAKKGKIFDLFYTAQMLWSDKYESRARLVYTELIQQKIPQLRDELRGLARPWPGSRDYKVISLPVAPDLLVARELKDLATGQIKTGLAGSFDLAQAQLLTAEPLLVPVQESFTKLHFLHTTTQNSRREAWEPLLRLAEYKVVYQDGTELIIPVEYGGNIRVWTSRYAQPMPQPYYRHQGYVATYLADPLIQAKTEAGRDITVMAYEWVNPKPECGIASISCRAVGEDGARVLLFAISGSN